MMTEKEIQMAKDEMFPYQENVGRSYEQALAASGFELGAHVVLNRLKSDRMSQKSSDDCTKDEIIASCIGVALTDVPESRFTQYGTTLKECIEWFDNLVKNQTKLD